MKIAIQGHPTRGKEIIQILESLGGINDGLHEGNNPNCYYELHGNIIWCVSTKGINFKYYTLEEFEQECPFKVGDKVTFKDYNYPYTIKSFDICFGGDIACEFEEDGRYYSINKLKLYKEMKEERNITLALDKAREWYKKGGELKEIALQAFTEKELNPLPKSWEEYIMKYGACCFSTRYTNIPLKYDALLKLEQLRDCWRNGWAPNWSDRSEKWCIALCGNELSVSITTIIPRFLTFPTKEMAKEFLKCFRDLIEKAGDLI